MFKEYTYMHSYLRYVRSFFVIHIVTPNKHTVTNFLHLYTLILIIWTPSSFSLFLTPNVPLFAMFLACMRVCVEFH